MALLTSACASNPPSSPKVKAKYKIDYYNWGMTSISKYIAEKECDTSSSKDIKNYIKGLSLRARSPKFFYGAKDKHTRLSFTFADESLKKGCLNNAGETYRNIISYYTGSAYSGIRDRAKIGIDDVRSEKHK